MFIGIVGPIATYDLLSESERERHKIYPKGRAGAPLISSLIKEYIARGHQVLAITIDPALNDDEPPFIHTRGPLTYVVAPSRKRIFRPNGKRMGRTADFYRFERKQITSLLRQYKPDVVHAHWTYEFALAALAYTPNALITIHDNARTILKYISTLERVFMLMLARYVLKQGRWFTAVSPYLAQSVEQWVSSEVFVVGNPITIPEATSRRAPPPIPIISLVVNGWEKRKNSGKALLAFQLLQQTHPDAVLWAIGDAFEPEGEAVVFCRKHQIDTTNIFFFGSIPYTDALTRIAQSTLLLHTSLEESFGMVLAEAMSYGVPVVAGKFSGAVPWVVQDGGLLVDVTKASEIAEAARKILTDQTVYAQLSENAINAIQTRFSIKSIADKYLDFYEKCSLYEVMESKDLYYPVPMYTQTGGSKH